MELAPVVERHLGALPASAEFLRRLDVAGIIDELCPVREVAHLTHGQVIEVLVANRLSSPTSMVRVGDWARKWAVEEVFGIEPDLLNDDRLARALDAIAPHLEEITGSIGAQAIAEFGIDIGQIHWDMTSMSLFGAYEDQEEDFPQVKYGHPKDKRVDLKQIQAGLAVSRDGGVPVFHRVYDGGAGEVAQVVGAMKALRKIAERKNFLLVADSKLVSYPNITALLEAKVDFVAPIPAARSRPTSTPPWTWNPPNRSTTSTTATASGTPPPTSESPTGSWKTSTSWPAPARPTRSTACAGSWSTPPATPKASKPPAPNAWPRPPRTWTSWNDPPAAATTTPPPRSRPASA
ncbi:IS1634 family transposase [Kitasatospora aureofaciens]